MDFSYILYTAVLKPEALVRFGFERSCASYLFNKSLEPEFSGFYVKILLSAEKITAEVFEKSVEAGGKNTDEKYALFDVPGAKGDFIGALRRKVSDIMDEIKIACFESADIKEKYFEYIENRFGVKPDFPWDNLSDYAVFRCKDKKWFSLVMKIEFKKLGIESGEYVRVANLKAPREKIADIVDGKTIFPAYHMNKKCWITVLLTSAADFEKICFLTEQSYRLVEK